MSRDFFGLLGQCIAAWALIDDELFRLFQECVGQPEQSAIIFYRTPGLDLRLSLTDEIFRSVLPRRGKAFPRSRPSRRKILVFAE